MKRLTLSRPFRNASCLQLLSSKLLHLRFGRRLHARALCALVVANVLGHPHSALDATRAAATFTPVQHAVQLPRVQRAAPVLPRSYLAMSHSLTKAKYNEPTRRQNTIDATRCVEAHLKSVLARSPGAYPDACHHVALHSMASAGFGLRTRAAFIVAAAML